MKLYKLIDCILDRLSNTEERNKSQHFIFLFERFVGTFYTVKEAERFIEKNRLKSVLRAEFYSRYYLFNMSKGGAK